MGLRDVRAKWPVLLGVAVVAGAAIAAVDNFACKGEVSPIVIVVLLFATTASLGVIGGRRGWTAALVVWAWVPSVHLVKHVLGLPDSLHPNTYASILMLALFSLAVAALGTGCGVLARGLAVGSERHAVGSAESDAPAVRPRE
jgi:hypothetical protein